MGKFLKENWFVAVIAIFFLTISVYFAYDQNKDNLPGKKVDGKDIVFSIGDENYSADAVYNDLYKTYSSDKLFNTFYKTLCDEKIKTTEELQASIDQQISSTIAYYNQYYGYGESYLDYVAQYYGYNSFREYVFYNAKGAELYKEYVNKHLDTLFTDEFKTEHSPRTISYTLIKMDKPETPTEEEQKRLQDAKDAWATQEYSFADFAKKYSEDSSTASAGGVLGYVDADSSLVEEFLKAALALEEGQVSDWVFSKDYGYFLIKCDSVKLDDFKDSSDFIQSIMSFHENLQSKIIWETAQELGFSATEDAEKLIKDSLGLNKDKEDGE